MKKTNILLANIVFLFACVNADKEQATESATTITSNDTNIVRKSDKKMVEEDRNTFFTHAAIGGLMEVEASSKLLEASKSNPQVVAHAEMIKRDHQKANEELKSIAKAENFILPTVLPTAKLQQLKQFEALNDEAKNEFYLNLMIAEHNEAINLFGLAESMDDQNIAKFAGKKLPVLRHHYKMTVDLKNSLLKDKKDQGDDVLRISDKRKENPAKNNN
jgi:putative membrane protein